MSDQNCFIRRRGFPNRSAWNRLHRITRQSDLIAQAHKYVHLRHFNDKRGALPMCSKRRHRLHLKGPHCPRRDHVGNLDPMNIRVCQYGNARTCLFSELRGQRCSSGGCPGTAADCHRVRKVQFGRSITVWPRPEHYRKRTCGAEPVAQLVLAAARYVGLSRPASVCASTVTCDNTRTCNSTWIVQRMPNSGRCVPVYLCAGLYIANGGGDINVPL